MSYTKTLFGNYKGKEVYLHRLENPKGAYLEAMNLGCRVRTVAVPDNQGKIVDVMPGYEDFEGFSTDSNFLGTAVGRVANRIKDARFSLDGKDYKLEANDGENNLHSGHDGIHAQVFDVKNEHNKLIFTYRCPDMESGFPGNLDLTITYSFSEDNIWGIEYKAVCDKDTLINLTNHAYFNLDGPTSDSVLDHYLKLNASSFTEAGRGFIPTGKIIPVAGTALDFTAEKAIGKDFDSPELSEAGGYDHNFILDGGGYREAAVVRSKKTGIKMSVFTDQPGVQLYSANNLNPFVGKGGKFWPKHSSLCLETQHYPNSPNIPEFPSIVLKKGVVFSSKTAYIFSAG